MNSAPLCLDRAWGMVKGATRGEKKEREETRIPAELPRWAQSGKPVPSHVKPVPGHVCDSKQPVPDRKAGSLTWSVWTVAGNLESTIRSNDGAES
jgi:hypothetical protein